jgi:UDP-N-acetylmuramoylalanine--D-glutamate ligase
VVRVQGDREILDRVIDICVIRTHHVEIALMDLKNKRVLVVGLGKSGAAAATLLHSLGARVTVSDARPQIELAKEIPALLDLGIAVETGAHGDRTFREQDLIVVSPGVAVNAPQLQQARALGIKVIGEVELAFRCLKGKVIAITGSNGKTTTTTLVGEILKGSGFKTQVGGNIGMPVTALVATADDQTWNVLEISSFQLETIETFAPHIAAILNITPDHLDRHGDFATYAAMKARIFENQTKSDYAVLNQQDATCKSIAKTVKSSVAWFANGHIDGPGAFAANGNISWKGAQGEQVMMPLSEIPLKGAHNIENVVAAVAMGMLAGCDPNLVRKAVRDFKAVEHRLEFVGEIDGVQYFNDSKATNVDATIKALESFPANIHLILGGKDKGSDYTVLRQLIDARVKRVYTIGAAAEKIESQLKGAPITSAKTLERAVELASEPAKAGDIVLLAPACASFDQFQSYEHRGRRFKELVQQVADRASAVAKGRG